MSMFFESGLHLPFKQCGTCCSEMLALNAAHSEILNPISLNFSVLQLKKQRLKEKIEADVGALVQFLLDERDSLLESLDAEEVVTMAVIDDNLKIVEKEAEAVDKAIVTIHNHISGKTSFEVSLSYQMSDSQKWFTSIYLTSICLC